MPWRRTIPADPTSGHWKITPVAPALPKPGWFATVAPSFEFEGHIGITESVRFYMPNQAFRQPIGITDPVSVVAFAVRAFTNTVGVSDSAAVVINAFDYYLEYTDNIVGITDNATLLLDHTVPKTEAVGITDSVVKVATRTVTEAIGITDAALKTVGRAKTEAISIIDSATKTVGRTATEAVGITDSTVIDFIDRGEEEMGIKGVSTLYISSATWNKPGGYAADDLFIIVCINGGQGGAKLGNSTGAMNSGAPPGLNGGWVGKEVKYSDLASSYSMTIGGGGAGSTSQGAAGSVGGATTFGALVAGAPGVSYLTKQDGTVIPMHDWGPGDGGYGWVQSTAAANFGAEGTNGEGNSFAPGGVNANGTAPPSGIPAGGGGGAGGTDDTVAGKAGAVPGGGGGGGGGDSAYLSASGGAGGAGGIYVIAPY